MFRRRSFRRGSMFLLIFLLLLVLALCGALVRGRGRAAAAPNALEMLRWAIISGGLSESAPYKLRSAVGQPMVGGNTAGTYNLCVGYVCGGSEVEVVYLPMAIK